MRVLFVHHVALLGGAERSLADLVAALDRSRFEASVALPADGELAETLRRRGLSVRLVPLRRFRRRPILASLSQAVGCAVRAVPGLLAILRRERVDLVHSNSATAHCFAGLAARIAGRPAFWHCRDLVRPGALTRLLARWSTRVIAISGAVRKSLAEARVADGVCVTIPNGLDVAGLRPRGRRDAVRRQWDIPEEGFLVAMAGQMVPWKKHGLFLEAASQIARRVPSARFWIAGEDRWGDHPEYRAALDRRAAELGVASRVRFLGHRPDWLDLLEGIDVLVHPADREPFGRVVAEAMALEKPVVAVAAGGPADLIRSGVEGVLVPPDDAAAIADEVCALAANPARCRELGRSARVRIARDFSLSACVSRVQSLYDSVLGGPAFPTISGERV